MLLGAWTPDFVNLPLNGRLAEDVLAPMNDALGIIAAACACEAIVGKPVQETRNGTAAAAGTGSAAAQPC